MFETERLATEEGGNLDDFLTTKPGEDSLGVLGQNGQEPAQDQGSLKTGDAQDPKGYEGLVFPGWDEAADGFDAFKNLAAELNLSPEAAQKLVDFESSVSQRLGKNEETIRQEILQRWDGQTKEMFGPRYEREVAVALRAADLFGGTELRNLLEATGLGSHPVIVKTFNEIGKRVCEDECVGGKPAQGSDRTFTEALYGVKSN